MGEQAGGLYRRLLNFLWTALNWCVEVRLARCSSARCSNPADGELSSSATLRPQGLVELFYPELPRIAVAHAG